MLYVKTILMCTLYVNAADNRISIQTVTHIYVARLHLPLIYTVVQMIYIYQVHNEN